MAQQITNSPGARFGYQAYASEGQRPARSAWCYGDPGIAAALLCAAGSRGNAAWRQTAVELGVAAADRAESAMAVHDAGICHGWGGLSHLFNRMYQASGEPRLADAARRYLERTLEMRRTDVGVAGFPAWQSVTGGWREEAGLLEGAAGVAMVLAAAASEVTPTWDSVLLISNTLLP
jgi:hypothetical protein